MTYITPDDLAMRQEMRDPWSKRGMVARGHLQQGNSLDATLPLMPEIPYSPVTLQRRVPRQAPPVPARYPFDGGWRDPGMSGLGENPDPYGAGPCPICGQYAEGRFRHLGSPVICPSGHRWGGTCSHPQCQNSPIPGMNGLGADPMATMIETITSKLKTQLIVQTAATAAASLTLVLAVNVIPIVGQVIGGLLLVANSLIGASFQRQGQQLVADFQDEMTRAGATFQAQVDAAQSAAFEQEKPAAIDLALSNQTLNGLGSLNDGLLEKIFSSDVFHTIANPLRVMKLKMVDPILKPIVIGTNLIKNLPVIGSTASDVRNMETKVEDQVDRPINAVDEAVDSVTGVKGLHDVEDAINKARPQVLGQMQMATNQAIANINSPAYRALLRNNIAKAIRSSAPLAAFSQAPGTVTITDATGVKPSTTISALPMAAAAGGVLLLLVGLGKH